VRVCLCTPLHVRSESSKSSLWSSLQVLLLADVPLPQVFWQGDHSSHSVQPARDKDGVSTSIARKLDTRRANVLAHIRHFVASLAFLASRLLPGAPDGVSPASGHGHALAPPLRLALLAALGVARIPIAPLGPGKKGVKQKDWLLWVLARCSQLPRHQDKDERLRPLYRPSCPLSFRRPCSLLYQMDP